MEGTRSTLTVALPFLLIVDAPRHLHGADPQHQVGHLQHHRALRYHCGRILCVLETHILFARLPMHAMEQASMLAGLLMEFSEAITNRNWKM